ncbi:MAG: hypothetical protein CW345_03290 [Firmicutes bacterium]|nr:hypothetical protein [Bacillota bacterium]MBO2520819.1 hypothetical protein [Bacillota bacterium]
MLSSVGTWVWVLFNLGVIVMLLLDLGVFHRHAHRVSVREAAFWSVFWIALALAFNVAIYFWMGAETAMEYLTGYLIEKSLSVDNLFVFALIFSYFRVPAQYQHRVLFWGILGALVMRGTLIFLGTSLISRFHWVFYLFGALLLFSGYRMLRHDKESEELDPEKNPVVRIARKVIPVTPHYVGEHLFSRIDGVLHATPLFVVLLVVESTDLVFAIDSIPAIFAITQDPFIVYTSNVFAILGLRSLYFLLAHVLDSFRYLSKGLALVLMFIGVKMLVVDLVHIPVGVSLGVVLGVVAVSIALSLWVRAKEAPQS